MSELNLTHSNGNKVKLTTPDTLAANKTFKLPGADGSGGQFLQTDGSGALSFASNLTGIQNMVNNGGMTVSQRYGTSENTPSNNGHTLDQMRYDLSQSSKFKVQQVTDAPAGFSHSMKVTSLSSYTSGANDYFLLQTFIEGTDSARLDWGTANAQTVTLSFYVKSSITGVHACGIRNQNYTRGNTQTYTINNANTWERKTVTFTGDTSGTWLTSTNSGLKINFDLGSGSNFQASSTGTWLGTNDFITSNSVKVLATNGATWYITGIQLQVGEIATPFEHLPFSEQLRRCERYYEVHWQNTNATNPAGSHNDGYNAIAAGVNLGSYSYFAFKYRTLKRSSPAISHGGKFRIIGGGSGSNKVADEFYSPSIDGCRIRVPASGTSGQASVLEFDGANNNGE